MDANHINSFIKAVDRIFSEIAGTKMERGKPYIKANPFTADFVAVVVGFTGDVKGQVVYNFHNGYAKKVAGVMCGGMEIAELDELATSALAEMCNMISGQAVMNLYEATGKRVNITPPAVMVGNKMQVFIKPPVLCIPFFAEKTADFEVNYSIN
ncbi:MAG: chemotaxis protein CheX [Peptococcaceae bacterium]|nr:chemotaxis protein CheX [Peptococcaceae bacterium]